MKATQTLPENYTLAWSVSLKRNTRLFLWLNLIGILWLFLVGWLLVLAFGVLRSDYGSLVIEGDLFDLLVFLLAMTVFIILHELVHGAFFWLFSGHRPVFGIGPGYAYAAMPDWYFPKSQYLIIGLSPLVVLTVLGLGIVPFVPLSWISALFVGLAMNAAGAIGDVYICWRIAREAESVWIKDKGDGFEVYRPG